MSLFLYVLTSQHTMRTFIISMWTKNYHSLVPPDTTSAWYTRSTLTNIIIIIIIIISI